MDEQSTDICSIYSIINSINIMSTAITKEEEVHEGGGLGCVTETNVEEAQGER